MEKISRDDEIRERKKEITSIQSTHLEHNTQRNPGSTLTVLRNRGYRDRLPAWVASKL